LSSHHCDRPSATVRTQIAVDIAATAVWSRIKPSRIYQQLSFVPLSRPSERKHPTRPPMPNAKKAPQSIKVTISAEQASAIEAFQAKEKIATQKEAVRMLLEIGVDTVSQTGNRFWDSRPELTEA
jgi:hypothetical protein